MIDIQANVLAQAIDHTLLRPDAVEEDIRNLCREAMQFGFASACLAPVFVRIARSILSDANVKVCTVVGFPTGAHRLEVKSEETRRALDDGADEIDMVVRIGALKCGNDAVVSGEIEALAGLCHDRDAILKVIIETALLNDDEKIRASLLVHQAGGDFVKTSTGFGSGGATAGDVRLIRRVLEGSAVGVKASGGIRSLKDALAMLEAGATRIGTSSGAVIMESFLRKQ